MNSSQPMKLLIPLVTWYYKISWQIKMIIHPLQQYLWILNLASYLSVVIAPVPFLLYPHTLSLWTQGHVNLYFNQHAIFPEYCFDLWNRFEWSKYILFIFPKQYSYFPIPVTAIWKALFDHVTNWNHYISTTTVSMTTPCVFFAKSICLLKRSKSQGWKLSHKMNRNTFMTLSLIAELLQTLKWCLTFLFTCVMLTVCFFFLKFSVHDTRYDQKYPMWVSYPFYSDSVEVDFWSF